MRSLPFSPAFVAAASIALLPIAPAAGATFTVGAGGTYASIQTAVNAALALGGDNSIKIRSGDYYETVSVPSTMSTGSLTLTGGWSAFFVSRDPDPSTTRVHAALGNKVLWVRHTGGDVRLEGLTLRDADDVLGTFPGGGAHVALTNQASLTLHDCRITGNRVTAVSQAGGGLFAYLQDASHLEVTSCRIDGNRAVATAGPADGGGVRLELADDATAHLAWTTLEDNVAETKSAVGGSVAAGLSAVLEGDSSLTVEDCSIRSNSEEGLATPHSTGGYLQAVGTGGVPHLTVRRTLWWENTESMTGSTEQLRLLAEGAAIVKLSDSLIVRGDADGLVAFAFDTSILRLTNLTIADNAGRGVSVDGDSTSRSLFNTVVYGNGNDVPALAAPVSTGGNLTGVDPPFADSPGGDYRLASGSTAIDTGVASPPGGLGPLDLALFPRTLGSSVDPGAYEAGGLFADGFESGNTSRWSL